MNQQIESVTEPVSQPVVTPTTAEAEQLKRNEDALKALADFKALPLMQQNLVLKMQGMNRADRRRYIKAARKAKRKAVK